MSSYINKRIEYYNRNLRKIKDYKLIELIMFKLFKDYFETKYVSFIKEYNGNWIIRTWSKDTPIIDFLIEYDNKFREDGITRFEKVLFGAI